MSRFTLATALSLSFALTGLAGTAVAQEEGPEMYIADCATPTAPEIPEGESATMEDIQAAITAFQAYNTQVSAYQTCMEEAVDAAEGEIDSEKRQEWRDMANAEIDKAQEVAATLREEVQTFQEMNGN